MKNFFIEFKKFAFKGNMLDLAVGMIIGTAFTGLVNSIVKNLIMPIISIFTGGIDFNNMYLPLSKATFILAEKGADLETAKKAGAVFAYGAFLTDFLQFLILLLCFLGFISFSLIRTSFNFTSTTSSFLITYLANATVVVIIIPNNMNAKIKPKLHMF